MLRRLEVMLRKGVAAALTAASLLPVVAAENEYETARQSMVKHQIKGRGIEDPAVLEAMREVPRHLFIEGGYGRYAYNDRPLPIGHGQTISQPYIVAYMTELLNLSEDDNVLEVGTGSGYQAAVLAEISRQVFTIEIIKPLAESAREHLKEAGYNGVTTRAGDGYYGWEEHAPFDAIIVTAAASHIPPPLIEQLKEGGRMVIPVGPVMRVQHLMLLKKKTGGEIVKYRKLPVRFVPLTGEH